MFNFAFSYNAKGSDYKKIGLTQGIAPAMYERIVYDDEGNVLNGPLMSN